MLKKIIKAFFSALAFMTLFPVPLSWQMKDVNKKSAYMLFSPFIGLILIFLGYFLCKLPGEFIAPILLLFAYYIGSSKAILPEIALFTMTYCNNF